MAKVVSVKKVGKEPVFNMYVEDNHNFAINGGLIVHNCDALRYFCTSYTFAPTMVNPLAVQREFDLGAFACGVGEYEEEYNDNEYDFYYEGGLFV